MANEKDYYEILGVSKNASTAEIKSAYRKLALAWHPDKHTKEKKKEAEVKFKEINQAYEVLSDSQKKSMYDQFGHAAFQPGSNMGGGQGPFGGFYQQGPFTYSYSTSGGSNPFDSFDFSDPFEIFEQFFGGGGFRSGNVHKRPRYTITLDFLEAVRGVTKEIHLPKGGAGEGSFVKTIKIPAGVDTGSRIRFDEFEIVIEVKKDMQFKREGDDIIVDVKVSYPQAVLGDTVEVPTIDGSLKLRIKPGTQSGTLIRLHGKGVSHVRGGGRGDEYVRILIDIPTHISRKERDLLIQLTREQTQ